MNCLIENEYIQGKKQKNTFEYSQMNLPDWKRILKGKKTEKNGKNKLAYFITGGLLIFPGSWRTLLWGGLLTPCGHYILKT